MAQMLVPLAQIPLGWFSQHEALVAWTVALSLAMFLGSLIAVPWVVVRLPPDAFTAGAPTHSRWGQAHPAVRLSLVITKNILGVVFVLTGLAMLVLPGQGLITLVIGISLIDFPGKPRLVRRIVRQRRVLAMLNWIRKQAKRVPLQSPAPPGE